MHTKYASPDYTPAKICDRGFTNITTMPGLGGFFILGCLLIPVAAIAKLLASNSQDDQQ